MPNNINNSESMTLGGCTREEWAAAFQGADWTKKLVATCVEIADAEDAASAHRWDACKVLINLANHNLIPARLPDGRTVAGLFAATSVNALAGTPKLALEKPEILDNARDEYSNRILACAMVSSMAIGACSDQPGPDVLRILKEALGSGEGGAGAN